MSGKCAACGEPFNREIRIRMPNGTDHIKLIQAAFDCGNGTALCMECDFRGRVHGATEARIEMGQKALYGKPNPSVEASVQDPNWDKLKPNDHRCPYCGSMAFRPHHISGNMAFAMCLACGRVRCVGQVPRSEPESPEPVKLEPSVEAVEGLRSELSTYTDGMKDMIMKRCKECHQPTLNEPPICLSCYCKMNHPVRRGPPSIDDEIWWKVLFFFNGDAAKADLWMKAENPLLGGISPEKMIKIGRGDKVLAWVRNQMENNEYPVKPEYRAGYVAGLEAAARVAEAENAVYHANPPIAGAIRELKEKT